VDEDMGEDLEPQKNERIEEWITLVHVCRRWRSVVFQSPRRLNIRLLCTPARDTLDIWPPLPLVVRVVDVDDFDAEPPGADNMIAALGHNDRVCQIQLDRLTSSELEYVTHSAVMQKPFPELTDLRLYTFRQPGPILPDSFLGGTAPRLRSLELRSIPFPGMPKLLLSATHLVHLDLYCIPRSGHIPPEVMATSLSALIRLDSLRLHFLYRLALETRPLPPSPLTRSILPSLTKVRFKGASEYLEEILARIDAPRLNQLHIIFFHQTIFDTPQLFQFISRRPTLRAPEKGHISFRLSAIIVTFLSQTSDYGVLSVEFPYTASEWQLSFLTQVCTSSLPPVSTLEDLYIHEVSYPHWQGDFNNTLWLNLLRLFVAVKNLYLSEESVLHIAPALHGLVGGITTEVLPTLENIFLEGFQPSEPLQEGIEKFVSARQLSSRPVTVFSLGQGLEVG
jgi:hypothetical protein